MTIQHLDFALYSICDAQMHRLLVFIDFKSAGERTRCNLDLVLENLFAPVASILTQPEVQM